MGTNGPVRQLWAKGETAKCVTTVKPFILLKNTTEMHVKKLGTVSSNFLLIRMGRK